MATLVTGPVRVRFAPSPTGFLHVGGVRTAIYNELLRLHCGGVFVLRIEDTDKARSDEAMTRQIQDALSWTGIRWDEGPFLQSERLPRHAERAAELLAADKAYRCFCTTEELEAQRAEAQKHGGSFRYPRTCAHMDPDEIARRIEAGQTFVVRFRAPDANITFFDLVRGDMDFPPEAIDDFILLRSDGSPTYHMSVVCDDIDMTITHVIRGEDHLSNTPKHVPLFQAFGAAVPTFAHLPLILGPDKKRLSKRFGATSVEEFRAEGILPEALYNYMSLLGWSPGDDREIVSREEMGRIFDVDRLNASAAVFDREKLLWMNSQYMGSSTLDQIRPHLDSFLVEAGLTGADPARLSTVLELHRSRARTLRELVQSVVCYFRDEIPYDAEASKKFLADLDLPVHLAALRDRFAEVEAFGKDPLEAALRAVAEERGVKPSVLIHPTRTALSGANGGPPLFDLVAAMGKDETSRHLGHFIAYLRRGGALPEHQD
ncbi:MAG: glutamate--tRNA ligase [Acidobacteriota bacterium]